MKVRLRIREANSKKIFRRRLQESTFREMTPRDMAMQDLGELSDGSPALISNIGVWELAVGGSDDGTNFVVLNNNDYDYSLEVRNANRAKEIAQDILDKGDPKSSIREYGFYVDVGPDDDPDDYM